MGDTPREAAMTRAELIVQLRTVTQRLQQAQTHGIARLAEAAIVIMTAAVAELHADQRCLAEQAAELRDLQVFYENAQSYGRDMHQQLTKAEAHVSHLSQQLAEREQGESEARMQASKLLHAMLYKIDLSVHADRVQQLEAENAALRERNGMNR